MPGLKRARTRCAHASNAGRTSSLEPSSWHATSRPSVPLSADSNSASEESAYWVRATIIFKPQPDTLLGVRNDHSRGNVFFAYFADFFANFAVKSS